MHHQQPRAAAIPELEFVPSLFCENLRIRHGQVYTPRLNGSIVGLIKMLEFNYGCEDLDARIC